MVFWRKIMEKMIENSVTKDVTSENIQNSKPPRQTKEERKEKVKQYRIKNKEAIKIKDSEYRKAHKEQSRIVQAKWRAENKEKIREDRRLFRELNKEKIREEKRLYRELNKEKIRIKKENDYKNNRDKVLNRVNAYRKNNAGIIREKRALHRRLNRDLYNQRHRKREAIKKNRFHPDSDVVKEKALYQECIRISKETGVKHQVDHIIPIAVGGWHHHDNLQILPALLNFSKCSNPFWEMEGFKSWKDVPKNLWPASLFAEYERRLGLLSIA
jgi:hypothetical protein